MRLNDLLKDVTRIVKDLENQDQSQAHRVEERTIGGKENGKPAMRAEYNIKAHVGLPSKEELEAFQGKRKEVKDANPEQNHLDTDKDTDK